MEELIYVNVVGFPDGNLEPVKATHVHSSCYRVVSANDDDEHFPWEFETGQVVHCEKVAFYEDEYGLVAKSECTRKGARSNYLKDHQRELKG